MADVHDEDSNCNGSPLVQNHKYNQINKIYD